MKLLEKFRNFFGKGSSSESSNPRAIVLMQRRVHRFSEDELRTAGERGWGKKFDGKEDPMYFVFADEPTLTVVKAGPHIIRLVSRPGRYKDDDEYALTQLPQPEQKQAWMEHHAFTILDLFNDFERGSSIPDKDAYASLAKLALQLGDPNCAAIFIPVKNIMMPNDGAAEAGLRFMINKEFPI